MICRKRRLTYWTKRYSSCTPATGFLQGLSRCWWETRRCRRPKSSEEEKVSFGMVLIMPSVQPVGHGARCSIFLKHLASKLYHASGSDWSSEIRHPSSATALDFLVARMRVLSWEPALRKFVFELYMSWWFTQRTQPLQYLVWKGCLTKQTPWTATAKENTNTSQ